MSPLTNTRPHETIETAVFSGMTAALDRFSHYSAPAVARDQRAARDGFGGIGVTLDTMDETFRVTAVAPQSPAERAGIGPGSGGHHTRSLDEGEHGPGDEQALEVAIQQGMSGAVRTQTLKAFSPEQVDAITARLP